MPASINEVLEYLRELNMVSIIVRCLLAVLLGGIIGIDRERKHRPAGFRTYMLVCLGSAMIMMLGQFTVVRGFDTDFSRMGAQVVSGIGFLGAGTIIITGQYQVRGLTTAAGLWASACIGLAIGAGFFEGAAVGFICILLVIAVLDRLGLRLRGSSKYVRLYIELEGPSAVSGLLRFLRERNIETDELELGNNRGRGQTKSSFIIVNLRFREKVSHDAVTDMLEEVDGILSIEEL